MLAPCIAVVGPANSGKTTLLHFLDRALAASASKPMAYVVKGNPDGTGRYLLFRSKQEREALKERVKGAWAEPTVDTICEWIRTAREYLDIVLLDFGGRRDAEVQEKNRCMLAECTHVIVLAKRYTDPDEEAEKGMEAWRGDCAAAGLKEIAVIESLWQVGDPEWRDEEGLLRASIRSDKDQPDDTANLAVIAELAARIEQLPQPGRVPAYVDLFRAGGWNPVDPYSQLEEIAPRLRRLAVAAGPVPLGGKSSIFSYLLAMHTALKADSETEILIFSPTIAWGLVDVPLLSGERNDSFPYDDLSVKLTAYEDGLQLDIRIVSKDKFLPSAAAQYLRHAPLPEGGSVVGEKVYVTGAAPAWLYAAYSRWLAKAGAREILAADKSSNQFIRVFPAVMQVSTETRI